MQLLVRCMQTSKKKSTRHARINASVLSVEEVTSTTNKDRNTCSIKASRTDVRVLFRRCVSRSNPSLSPLANNDTSWLNCHRCNSQLWWQQQATARKHKNNTAYQNTIVLRENGKKYRLSTCFARPTYFERGIRNDS